MCTVSNRSGVSGWLQVREPRRYRLLECERASGAAKARARRGLLSGCRLPTAVRSTCEGSGGARCELTGGEFFLCGRIRKFQGVSSLTIFVQENFGGDNSRIYYIGLKGESKKVRFTMSNRSHAIRTTLMTLIVSLVPMRVVAPWRRRSGLRKPPTGSRPQGEGGRQFQHAELRGVHIINSVRQEHAQTQNRISHVLDKHR